MTNLILKHQELKLSESALKAEVEKELIKLTSNAISESSKIVEAEVKSEKFIVYSWRPIVALSFCFSVLFFGLIEPVLVAWAGVPMVKPDLKVLEWLNDGAKICLGGYIAGRSVEKIAETITKVWRR